MKLLSKSEDDETKRLFIEAILSLLTIGVISLDNNFNINFFNQSVLNILGIKNDDLNKKILLMFFLNGKKF